MWCNWQQRGLDSGRIDADHDLLACERVLMYLILVWIGLGEQPRTPSTWFLGFRCLLLWPHQSITTDSAHGIMHQQCSCALHTWFHILLPELQELRQTKNITWTSPATLKDPRAQCLNLKIFCCSHNKFGRCAAGQTCSKYTFRFSSFSVFSPHVSCVD